MDMSTLVSKTLNKTLCLTTISLSLCLLIFTPVYADDPPRGPRQVEVTNYKLTTPSVPLLPNPFWLSRDNVSATNLAWGDF